MILLSITQVKPITTYPYIDLPPTIKLTLIRALLGERGRLMIYFLQQDNYPIQI